MVTYVNKDLCFFGCFLHFLDFESNANAETNVITVYQVESSSKYQYNGRVAYAP